MTTYRKAWAAKHKAIEKVFGGWKSSFEDLSQWCMAICAAHQGAIVQLDSVEASRGGDLVPNNRIFRKLFWTFSPCVKAFRYCKPLVQVDGTHLYGKYRGALLVAVAQDGNQNILPITFVIFEGETADAWSFFLNNVRRHVVTRDRVGLISDRHESIKAAVAQNNGQWEPPKAFYMYCVRHISANFVQRFKAPNLRRLVVSIGYSRTEQEFNHHYQRMHERGQRYIDWLDEIPWEKWVLAFDGGHRWGHITTNLVECINSVLKEARNLPITSLVQATYFRSAELFVQKSSSTYARRNVGQPFSEVMARRLEANEKASKHFRTIHFDRQLQTYHVKELSGIGEYRVDMRQRYCDCGDFQIYRYLCRHVIACCNSSRLDWKAYVDDVYRMITICKVYKNKFGVMGHQSTWPWYTGSRICANPSLKCTMKGRPKSTRYLNEMDMSEMRGPRRCGLCRDKGHSRSRCPNAPGSSS